jgi:hypothetical protein
MVFPFGLGVGPLAAVEFVSLEAGLQNQRQKAHRQSPSPYSVRFEAVCLFANEQESKATEMATTACQPGGMRLSDARIS